MKVVCIGNALDNVDFFLKVVLSLVMVVVVQYSNQKCLIASLSF